MRILLIKSFFCGSNLDFIMQSNDNPSCLFRMKNLWPNKKKIPRDELVLNFMVLHMRIDINALPSDLSKIYKWFEKLAEHRYKPRSS